MSQTKKNSIVSVQDIYDSYISDENDKKVKSRYLGNESWYHSSASGMCLRKHYFSSFVQPEEPPRESNTYRLFRLGEIVHTDIQEAV